jgi:hypothetical protein
MNNSGDSNFVETLEHPAFRGILRCLRVTNTSAFVMARQGLAKLFLRDTTAGGTI